MSSQSSGRTGPFWHNEARQRYWYDVQRDVLVFENGQSVRRPENIPRSLLMGQTSGEQVTQGYSYSESPPEGSTQYITSGRSAHSGSNEGSRSVTTAQQRDTVQPPRSSATSSSYRAPTAASQAPTSRSERTSTAHGSAATPSLSQGLTDLSLEDSRTPSRPGTQQSTQSSLYQSRQGASSDHPPDNYRYSTQQQAYQQQYPSAHITQSSTSSAQPTPRQRRSSNTQDVPPLAGSERTAYGKLPSQQLPQQQQAPPPYHPEPVQASVTDSAGRRFVDIFNQRNLVRTYYQTAPPNQITDPALFKGGVRAYRMLMDTQDERNTGETEKLFATFKVRDQPRNFFTAGKVFLVLWVEPAGETRTQVTNYQPGTTTGRYGEMVFSKVRRFVVIRGGAGYCSALPIATYGRQGVGKPGVVKSEHAIIYTGKVAPEPVAAERPMRGEAGMRSEAIRVNLDSPEDKLDSMSRIDFGKVHTIQHNIKVRSYGSVHPRSMSALLHQFGNIFGAPPAAPTPRTSGNAAGSISSRPRTESSATPAARRESASNGQRSHPSRSNASASSHGRTGGAAPSPVSEGSESDDGEDDADDDDEEETAPRQEDDQRRYALAAAIDGLLRRGYPREQAIALVRTHFAQGQQRDGGGRDNNDDND